VSFKSLLWSFRPYLVLRSLRLNLNQVNILQLDCCLTEVEDVDKLRSLKLLSICFGTAPSQMPTALDVLWQFSLPQGKGCTICWQPRNGKGTEGRQHSEHIMVRFTLGCRVLDTLYRENCKDFHPQNQESPDHAI
jgi:hypothetical protein